MDSNTNTDSGKELNRARQLNLKYQAEKKKWDSLPWRKRIRIPEPKPPTGI
jgi:hypothetical protein